MRSRTDTISGPDQWSTPVALRYGGTLTLTGTWSAIVTVQRRLRNGDWIDVTDNDATLHTFTLNGTYAVNPIGITAAYRWGIKAGEYTSGDIVGTLEGA